MYHVGDIPRVICHMEIHSVRDSQYYFRMYPSLDHHMVTSDLMIGFPKQKDTSITTFVDMKKPQIFT